MAMIMPNSPLQQERLHLSVLLDAIQRCAYFLEASRRKLLWPLSGVFLEAHNKDVDLYESLAAINERFAKLQDTLGGAMRHAHLLAGESGGAFLNILVNYEKIGVIESVAEWQLCRTTRNLAAHDYETDYVEIADHFNALHALTPPLYGIAKRLVRYCSEMLGVVPQRGDFSEEFVSIESNLNPCSP